MKMYKFAAAGENETIVFGAARPGYSHNEVQAWIQFMKGQGIRRVCCLLPDSQLARYSNLIGTYQQEFGSQQVCWTPIEDFCLCDLEILTGKLLPFLAEADKQAEKVVVHCSGGIGRTGHVLAAWLVSCRGFSHQAAIASMLKTGRNPYEAAIASLLKGKNPFQAVAELHRLLDRKHKEQSPKSD
jgi:protein-tyrosine phosphatase